MALGRRGNGQSVANIWPGFVDAMTALLLVLFFVISIFMIVQFVLSETITDQDQELSDLAQQVAGLADALGLEQNRSRTLASQIGELDGALSSAASRNDQQSALIASLSQQRDDLLLQQADSAAKIASFEEQVAGIMAQNRDREAEILARTALEIDAKEAAQLALAQARSEIDAEAEAARLAAARADALEAMIADLEAETGRRAAQITDMQSQIASATQALFLAQVARREAQQQITALTGENRNLETSLNAAQSEISDERETLAGLVSNLATISAEKAVLEGQLAIAERGRIAALAQLETLQADADTATALIAQAQTDLADQTLSLEQARENADRLAALLEDRETAVIAAELALTERAAQLDEAERARVSEAASAAAARAELAAIQEATRALQEDLNISQMARIAVLQELSSARETSVDTNTALAISQTRLATVEQEMAEREAGLMAAEDALEQARQNEERLAELLSEREVEITAAELALAERAAALSDAEKAQLADAAAAEALRARLQAADTEITAMTLALEEERQKALETLTQLAAARAAQRELAESEGSSLSVIEQQQVALAEAQRLLRIEEAASADSQRQIALLNQQTAALRSELNQLQGLLDASAAKDIEAQIRIESLGSELNTALARAAAEQRRRADAEAARADAETARADAESRERALLEAEATTLRSFRSEFFGKMREVLGEREGVQIVGDRFVFSSEVLFAVGSADLGADGRAQIGRVASVLLEISEEIPEDLNWILRVDGHTDKTRLGTGGRYADNWELSQARALSVVRYLIEHEGVPANRLAATGFGEFQPINPGHSPEDLSQNRRIELKLTER
ncbi:MAG: peptidoglycan -binding protein [Rhodobacteraceae bacterium]|nr:peptidoglycan -binding protein [Paracoccaceae bacterium]